MANFPPFKQYLLYCLGRLISQYHLKPSFLDVGCGIGDVSEFVASKGWNGKAIDISENAIQIAKQKLSSFSGVDVQQQLLEDVNGKFETIFLMDILEHLEDDKSVLKKVSELLHPTGFLVLSVPSNPGKEWRWDDECYGHLRRYSVEGLTAVLKEAGLTPVLFWDFTFPFFWGLRRVQTKLTRPPAESNQKDVIEKTKQSGLAPVWQQGWLAGTLSKLLILWWLVYMIQFHIFKRCLSSGYEMLVLVQKQTNSTNV